MSQPARHAGALGGEVHQRYKWWRYRIFWVMWALYAGYYLGRKNYSVAQPGFMEDYGWEVGQVGIIVTAYLTMYAVGQFINGPLGDRFGARRMIFFGLGLTIAANLMFGFATSIAMMMVLWGLNGLAQSTGWPCSMKVMANWFSVDERGRVMAWWTTNYQVGDVAATAIAAYVIGMSGWRMTFWVPAVLLLGVAILFWWGQRNRPEDVGLPDIHTYRSANLEEAADEVSPADDTHSTLAILRDVLSKPVIWILGGSYFFLKFVRYTFLFWLPTYFVQELGYEFRDAGMMSLLFPLSGFAGSVFAGYASDRLFNARRGPVGLLMLIALALLLFVFLPVADRPVLSVIVLVLTGFATYGPDSLLSGTATMDFGSRKGASTAAGFVNGLGSIGAALSGVATGYLEPRYGWEGVFNGLMVSVVICGCLVAFLWNARGTD